MKNVGLSKRDSRPEEENWGGKVKGTSRIRNMNIKKGKATGAKLNPKHRETSS